MLRHVGWAKSFNIQNPTLPLLRENQHISLSSLHLTQVLQWCRENGCPWGGGTCANSAEGGHLDVLKWARGEGCPWTEATCALAARENQFEILKWARRNGCNWASSTFR